MSYFATTCTRCGASYMVGVVGYCYVGDVHVCSERSTITPACTWNDIKLSDSICRPADGEVRTRARSESAV